MGPKWKANWSALYPLLLILVSVATYANTLDAPLIYDDEIAIVRNPYVQQLWPPWRIAFAPPNSPTEGRPLVSLSLAINYALGGIEDVRGYHAVNVAIHILSALLLYGIVRRTLRLEKLRARFGSAADGLALACGLLWMVHPLVTEPVNYISQRSESLMALFYLLTLYCAIRAIDSPRRGWWIAGAAVACGLGMASKEVMVTAPVMVLLYDVTLRTGSVRETLRQRWPLYAALAATWIVLAALMLGLPHQGSVGFTRGASGWEYAKNQSILIVRYLQLAVWPHPLLIDYGTLRPVSLAEAAPYAVVVLALLAATIVALFYRPAIGLLGAWFFVVLSPTSSFVPLKTEVGAERRMYLPLAALVVLAVLAGYALLDRLSRRWRTAENGAAQTEAAAPRGDPWMRRLGGFALVAVCGVLIFFTYQRNAEFHDPRSLWQAAADATADNYRAYNNLGLAHQRQRNLADAEASYQEALEIKPDFFDARHNLGNVLAMQGKLKQAKQAYQDALAIRERAGVHFNLGTVCAQLRQPAEAEVHYTSAIRLNPESFEAHYNLGGLLAARGELRAAVDHYRRALELKPDYAEAHNNLGSLFLEQGNLPEARKHFERAIAVKPNYAEAHFNLATVLARSGDVVRAASHYERSLQAEPNYAVVQRIFAALLDTDEKRARAGAHLSRRLAAQPDNAAAHFLLAVLRQREGDLREAVTHYREILKRAPDTLPVANQLAWILAAGGDAALRNGEEAMLWAKRCAAATGYRQPVVLATLAAACAESGKFEEAVRWQTRALELAPPAKRAQFRPALRRYQAGKKYGENEALSLPRSSPGGTESK